MGHADAQVGVAASVAGDDLAVLTVDDDGAGIPEERREAVFDRFVRSADTGGSGLGLAIAKRLVEAHGGTIEAIASPEGGTCIRFTIPAA